MVQTKRQRAIIIDIKQRIERGNKRKEQLLTNPSDFEKSSKIHFEGELRRTKLRSEFLNEKLKQAQSGKSVFKKDLTTSSQILEQGRV